MTILLQKPRGYLKWKYVSCLYKEFAFNYFEVLAQLPKLLHIIMHAKRITGTI